MDDENEEIQEANQPSDLTREARRPRNKVKDAGKKVASNIKDAFKEGFKGIWKALPLKAKLIVAAIIGVIVFIACIYVVYADYFISASEDTITDYYSNSSTASEEAKNLYNSTGSLLFATNDDINAISEKFLEDVKPRNNTLYDFMSKKYKNGDPDNSGVELKESFWTTDALNINSQKTLYAHLLNAERYNFNKIRWIKYKRDENKGAVPLSEMKVEPNAQLQYPDDSDNTGIDTLSSMVRPYLQSWIIPYGLFSGLLSEGTGDVEKLDYGQFAYQVLIEGYHEIVMNQYNLDVLTVETTQNVYDELEYTVTRTCSRDSEGNETVTTTHVLQGDGKPYKIVETCKKDAVVETRRDVTHYVVYKLESAKTFDRIFENTYNVHLYSEANDTPEHSMTRVRYSTGDQLTQTEINAISSWSFSNSIGYAKYQLGESNSWTGTYTYKIKKGYTQNETKIWKDKVETLSEIDRELRVYDVEKYIDPDEDGNPSLSGDEKAYYQNLAVEENVETVRMTRVDVINAKKEVYSNYLKSGANYSENIGYPRTWWVFSLDALKKHARAVEESDTGWKYLYGASLGLDIKIEKPTTESISGAYATLQDYDATGVLKTMQETYAEYELVDNRGYTYQTVPVYTANADYAWDNWKDYVTEVCEDYSTDPNFPLFVLAKMCIESSGGKNRGWGSGPAAGPMQIEKSIHLGNTMSAYNVKTGQTDTIVMTRENLSDDNKNIRIGVMYYANQLKSCNGNPYLAAQKYNYGNIGFVSDYAKRVNKDKDSIIADVNDVGWVYESMKYHNSKKAGDAYYAYKFAFYLDYLKKK